MEKVGIEKNSGEEANVMVERVREISYLDCGYRLFAREAQQSVPRYSQKGQSRQQANKSPYNLWRFPSKSILTILGNPRN
jgi:hypothetical protein